MSIFKVGSVFDSFEIEPIFAKKILSCIKVCINLGILFKIFRLLVSIRMEKNIDAFRIPIKMLFEVFEDVIASDLLVESNFLFLGVESAFVSPDSSKVIAHLLPQIRVLLFDLIYASLLDFLESIFVYEFTIAQIQQKLVYSVLQKVCILRT